jgi:integrase
MNTTAIVPATPTAIVSAQRFDTSILAGVKSPSSIAQYKLHFAAYLAFAGDWQTAMQPSTLARWRQALYEDGFIAADGSIHQYSVNSINQRLAAIRGVMAEAAQQGYVSHEAAEAFRHVKGLKAAANKERRNAHARTRISRTEMRAIIDAPNNTTTAAGKMHRALLLTLATAGLRISEAVTLQQSQLEWGTDDDGKQGWMVHVAGKGQADAKPRAMGREAKIAIDEWLAARTAMGVDSPYIFTGFAGRGDRDPSAKPITRQSAWEMVQRYAKQVGLEHIKPHDFRRFVGAQLAKRDIRLAQNQLGHKRIETTAQNYVLDGVRLGITDDLV